MNKNTPNAELVHVIRNGEPVSKIVEMDLFKNTYKRISDTGDVVEESLKGCVISGLTKVMTKDQWHEYCTRRCDG